MNPAVPLTLLPALLLVFRAGRVLAGWATGDRVLARLLTPACALALWLLSVHVLGLWTQSFWLGLFVGTTLVAALGLGSLFLEPPDEEPGLPLGWGAFLAAALAVALLLGMELRYFVWDENLITGHLSIPLQMLNGIYPPHHLTFSIYELRYHYGFDLLNACVAALLGQPPMRGVVHGVTLALWGYLALLAWALGQRLIAPRAGPISAACCLLSGGVPFFCKPFFPLPQYFEGHCSADGLSLMPPLASNFLQHPWSLGLPLGMAILLVFQLRRARELGWWAALTVLLLLLSFSQVVLFGCLGASVALAGGLTTPGKRWKQLLLFGLWGLALLATASRLHGFFAHTAEPEYLRLDFSPFWRGSIGQWALYLAMALGLGLPLGLVGFWLLRRERLVFGILAVMGLGVFSLYRYPNSWDIVKFLMVVQIAFTVTGSATLWAAFRRPWWRWLAAPALVALVAHSVLWLGTAAIGKYNGWYTTKLDPLAAPAADRRMIDYLRAHIGAGEAVWRRDATADYALLGGLPVQQPDYGASSFGFSHHAWDSRTDLVDHPRPAIDDYEKQGIRWFVLGPWDVHVHNEVDLWVKEGRAEARLKEPPLELFYAK